MCSCFVNIITPCISVYLSLTIYLCGVCVCMCTSGCCLYGLSPLSLPSLPPPPAASHRAVSADQQRYCTKRHILMSHCWCVQCVEMDIYT